MATGLMAGTASASAHGPFPGPGTTAMTLILTNDVPGNGGVWAIDSVWRTATVTVAGGFPGPAVALRLERLGTPADLLCLYRHPA
jgi:hypothetical protein